MVHEVIEADEKQATGSKKLAELHISNGGAIGSTQIDNAFEDLIDILTFPSFMKDFKTEHFSAYTSLMNNYDMKKRIYASKSADRFEVELNYMFHEFYRNKIRDNGSFQLSADTFEKKHQKRLSKGCHFQEWIASFQ